MPAPGDKKASDGRHRPYALMFHSRADCRLGRPSPLGARLRPKSPRRRVACERRLRWRHARLGVRGRLSTDAGARRCGRPARVSLRGASSPVTAAVEQCEVAAEKRQRRLHDQIASVRPADPSRVRNGRRTGAARQAANRGGTRMDPVCPRRTAAAAIRAEQTAAPDRTLLPPPLPRRGS